MARALLGAGFALVLAAASACAPGGGEGLRFLVFGEPEELRAFREIVQAFEAREDGVEVDLVEASDRADLLTRVSTSMAAGSPPDVFLVNYRYFGQFAAREALFPIEDALEEPGGLERDDFFDISLAAFEWDGTLQCLPQNISSLAVYYNEALFDAAGRPHPPDGYSWDQMVADAQALTVDEDGDGKMEVYGLGIEPSVIRLSPVVWASGGEMFRGDPVEGFALDTVPALDAVQDFFDLRGKFGVVPTDPEMESESLEARFLNGGLAMYVSSRRSVPVLRSIRDFGWDVAPFPARDQPVNVLHSDAYCITRGSDHHEDAIRFVEFALGPEGQRIAVATGRTVPSLRAVATSDAFLDDRAEPARSQVFLDAVPHLRLLPTVATWPEIEDLADGLVEEAMFEPGGEAVEFAQVLRAETDELFRRARERGRP